MRRGGRPTAAVVSAFLAASLGAAVPTATATTSATDGAEGTQVAAVSAGSDDYVLIHDGLAQDPKLLAKDLGVSDEAALGYLDTQMRFGEEVSGAAQAAAGTRLAGSWIDWTPEPVLTVAVTGDDAIPALTKLAEHERGAVQIQYGRAHSRSELIEALNRAAAAITRSSLEAGVALSEQSNGLLIDAYVPKGVDPRVMLGALDAVVGDVEVPIEFDILDHPGDDANRGGRYLSSCTSAFTVWNTATQGYLTAGHCGSNQDYRWWSDGSWWQAVQMGERHTPDYDVQWHDPVDQPVAPVFHTATSLARPQEGLVSYNVNSWVCHWGSRSNTATCGYVRQVLAKPNYQCEVLPDCNASFVKVEGTSLYQCRGDSGGPWYIGNRAVGVHKGGSLAPNSECSDYTGMKTFFFTDISRALGTLEVALFTG